MICYIYIANSNSYLLLLDTSVIVSVEKAESVVDVKRCFVVAVIQRKKHKREER